MKPSYTTVCQLLLLSFVTDLLSVSRSRSLSYSELHALGTGGSQLAAHHDLAALGTALHDESQHTVACSSHGQTVQQLVSEGLALGDGGQTTVLDLGGVQGHAVLGELESLLDQGGELANSSTLLAQDFLGVCGPDDCRTQKSDACSQVFFLHDCRGCHTDIGDCGSDPDFDTRVALFSQLALEELVQLGIEDTVGDELALLRDGSWLSRHVGGCCRGTSV